MCKIRVLVADLEKHRETCPRKMVSCYLINCKRPIQRKDRLIHIVKEHKRYIENIIREDSHKDRLIKKLKNLGREDKREIKELYEE